MPTLRLSGAAATAVSARASPPAETTHGRSIPRPGQASEAASAWLHPSRWAVQAAGETGASSREATQHWATLGTPLAAAVSHPRPGTACAPTALLPPHADTWPRSAVPHRRYCSAGHTPKGPVAPVPWCRRSPGVARPRGADASRTSPLSTVSTGKSREAATEKWDYRYPGGSIPGFFSSSAVTTAAWRGRGCAVALSVAVEPSHSPAAGACQLPERRKGS